MDPSEQEITEEILEIILTFSNIATDNLVIINDIKNRMILISQNRVVQDLIAGRGMQSALLFTYFVSRYEYLIDEAVPKVLLEDMIIKLVNRLIHYHYLLFKTERQCVEAKFIETLSNYPFKIAPLFLIQAFHPAT